MFRALFPVLGLLFFASACTYDNGDARRVLYSSPAAYSNIDADPQGEDGLPTAPFTIDVGQGAGLFIEYQSGGHWLMQTSCDTLKTNTTCQWQVYLTPHVANTLSNVVGSDLEANDSVQPDGTGTYYFSAWTDQDLDAVSFDTEPRAAVEFDAALDGVQALPYLFWVGDGALHSGSPASPLVLTPTSE